LFPIRQKYYLSAVDKKEERKNSNEMSVEYHLHIMIVETSQQHFH